MAKPRTHRRPAAALLCAAGLSLTVGSLLGCASKEPAPSSPLELSGATMGTSYSITLPAATGGQDAIGAAVRQALDRVDALMSTYRADSEVSRFNRHESVEPFPVSAETHAVLATAQELSATTGGAFDITVGPLVDVWGFGPREISGPPSEETVGRLVERTGWQKLVLGPRIGRSARLCRSLGLICRPSPRVTQ